jgi:2-oxoglutarate dehydrogenase E2 component (dihydrolipoamide succinyltransferase)
VQSQPLVEVTTDKVDVEIPSPVAGVVERIAVSEGDVVSIGAELARVDPDAQNQPDRSAAANSPAPAPAREVETEAAVEVSPARGTLPAGLTRYVRQDGDRVIPMTPLRRLVAEHMVYSKRTSPHVGTVAEIDMAGVVQVRDRNKRAFRDAHGFSLSFLPFLVHATVRALLEFPRLNASVIDDAIVERGQRHIGIAVETDNGLIVPVVRHADRLSLTGLAKAIEDLASRARSKRLAADELQGGTFTISNPGRDGNLYGFAIINQPQVAILRMGEIVKRPCVRTVDGEDALVIRPVMHLALSYDHRAVDGAPANGFLHRVRQLLERAEFEG